MNTELLKNPRDVVRATDGWIKRSALISMVRNPLPTDREIFEDLLDNHDLILSLMAFLGLKKLFPPTRLIQNTWKELFGESVDLLVRRAYSGPIQLRITALKALAFAPEHLSFGLVEKIIESLELPISYETINSGESPELALIQAPQKFQLPEGFAVLLASLPGKHEQINLLRRELSTLETSRLLPVLLALQLNPAPELVEVILPLVRSPEKRIAIEAARALLLCGGNKVYLIILSLLKETTDQQQKAMLLPLIASTNREEVWPILLNYAESSSPILSRAAIIAAESFAVPVEKKILLYRKTIKSKDPETACLAAQFAWKSGSLKALHILERYLTSDNRQHRECAAAAFGNIAAETSLPILASRFDCEKSGDVIRQLILSVRKLLPDARHNMRLHDQIIPWLNRLMRSTDAFKRSQCAILCGILGKPAEEIILKYLEIEHHPHVIASLLSSLGHIGSTRLLLYSRFSDHTDSRVRANMITAMLVCGGEAVPYFTEALKDNSPRVRSAATKNLFLLGQLDIIGTLNRMLLVPDPLSVLAGCYCLGQLLRVQPPLLESEHPLPIAISRKTAMYQKNKSQYPQLLNTPEISTIFKEMAIAGGNRKKLIWILEDKTKRFPSSYAARRMLASLLIFEGNFQRASDLISSCLRDAPGVLADLLDAYRIAIKLGNLDKATDYGEAAKNLYNELLAGCLLLCRSIRGSGADLMLKKLHHLTEPSMNLYNAMIQLKVLENEDGTVLDLMAELTLARPNNPILIRKLATMLPDTMAELRQSLSIFAGSLPELL